MAAKKVRRTLLKKAGETLRIDPEKLDPVDREVVDTVGSGKFVPLKGVV